MRKIFTLFVAALCCAVTIHATEGALPGKFTINAEGDQVQFSKGNLQVQASTNTWYFAENQFETIEMPTINEEGEFANPSQKRDRIEFYEYRIQDNEGFAIINGGNATNVWRGLTFDEWNFLLDGRANANKLRGAGQIDGNEGYILMPDNYMNQGNFKAEGSTSENVYTESQWLTLQNEGAVFFPFVRVWNIVHRKIKVGAVEYVDEYELRLLNGIPNNCYWTDRATLPPTTPHEHYEDIYKFYGMEFKADGSFEMNYQYYVPCSTLYCEIADEESPYFLYGFESDEKFYAPVRLVQPYEEPEGIESPSLQGRSGEASKVIRDGVLYIERNGRTYNAQGAEVK